MHRRCEATGSWSLLFKGSVSSRPQHGCPKRRRHLNEMECRSLFFVAGRGYFEDGEERFLRDVHLADAFHALFAFFLFLEEFAFARNVAAVALAKHVLANRGNGF